MTMIDKITREQLEDLSDAFDFGTPSEFHEILVEYTGIVAKPYTAYQYFNEFGDYIGDSNDFELLDLLQNARIEVVR